MAVAIVSVLSCANPRIHSEACVQPCVTGVVHNESLLNQMNRVLFIVSHHVSHASVEVFIMSLCFSHAQMAKLLIRSCEKCRADNESVQSYINCDVHNESVQSCINSSFQSCICGDVHDESLFNFCINFCF